MKKRMMALLLAGVMVFSLTACGGGGASSKNQQKQEEGDSKQVGVEVAADEQQAPPEDAPVGGQLVVAINPGSLSPDMREGWSRNATNAGFISLMYGYPIADYNREHVLDWDPVVVKEHEVIKNDDGSKTYRIVLNENLKWSDGNRSLQKTMYLIFCSTLVRNLRHAKETQLMVGLWLDMMSMCRDRQKNSQAFVSLENMNTL